MQFIIPDNLQTREKRVSEHVNQSRQILNLVSAEKKCSGWTTYIGASYEDMEWFRAEYRKLVEKLEDKSLNSNKKELFSITYTDIPTEIFTQGVIK
jgi:hypothetical protein